jgi:hypothetical protein
MWVIFLIFKNLPICSKQSPIGRKFAQSGHPAKHPTRKVVHLKKVNLRHGSAAAKYVNYNRRSVGRIGPTLPFRF